MNLRFANPWMLYLLWLVPLLGLWLYAMARRAETGLSAFVSQQMQARLRPAASRTRALWQGILLTGAVLFSLIALARPQWGMKDETVFQRGRDLMIALDVSRSMRANDVHPNRLQRAKADLMDLVRELRGDRAGLIVFRHKAALLCPLTTDYAYLVHALDAADVDSAPAGSTDIGDAIFKALEAFDNQESSHKAIVLISDGEDLSGRAQAAAQHAMTNGVPVFTVGIGSRRGSRIPEEGADTAFMKYQGNDVVTRLNDNTLESIARITGGAYIPIGIAGTTSTTLGTLYRDYLKNVTDQDLEETLRRRHVERYQIFLLPAFLMMAACALLSRGRLGTRTKDDAGQKTAAAAPTRRLTQKTKPGTVHAGAAAALMLAALTVSSTYAQTNPPAAPAVDVQPSTIPPPPLPPGRAGARVAQKLYRSGKYREAADAYLNALKGSTDKSQHDFRYNAAVALFKGGRYSEAAEILDDITRSSGPHSAPAAAALGAALHREAEISGEPNVTNLNERAELLVRSAAAFKDAARAAEDGEPARRNLQVVLNQLPEAREQARIAGLMDQYGQESAPALAMKMLAQQRNLIEQMPAAFTNASPSSIEELEALAAAQRATADMWIPLKQKIMTAVASSQDITNRQIAASIEQTIEGSRDAMVNAAENLRNLDPNGYRSAVVSEELTYGLWKAIAPYELVLQEDLLRQTNSIMLNTPGHKQPATPRNSPQIHQDEALALTRLFIDRFSQAVPEGGTVQEAPAGTPNTAQPGEEQQEEQGISAEKRAMILKLAQQAVTEQEKARDLLKQPNPVAALPGQNESHRLLKEIEKLLPRQKQQQQQQDQQPKEDQKQEQEQKEPGDDQQKPDQDQQPPEPREQPEPEQKEVTPEDVKKLLEKALEREKEHEDELRRRNRIQMRVPFEQDW